MYDILIIILNNIGIKEIYINIFSMEIVLYMKELLALGLTLLVVLATSILMFSLITLPFKYIHSKIHEWSIKK